MNIVDHDSKIGVKVCDITLRHVAKVREALDRVDVEYRINEYTLAKPEPYFALYAVDDVFNMRETVIKILVVLEAIHVTYLLIDSFEKTVINRLIHRQKSKH